SAARLARAQQAAEASRPFGAKLQEVFASVVNGLEPDVNPLLVQRPAPHKLDIVVVTSDRGLCGAFNANMIKTATSIVAERRADTKSISVIPIGRRGRDHMRRRKIESPRAWTGSPPNADTAREIAQYLLQRFLSGESDEAILVYSRFQSAISQ